MKEFKIFTDFREEEKYLNEKAKQGHLLIKYTALGRYHFADGKPQDLKYKIDYRTFKNQQDFNDYKALFEDAGWNHVYGTRTSFNQYFLPLKDNVSDEIFSDKESSAKRYKSMLGVCIANLSVVIMYLFIILVLNDFNIVNFAFLTPGLWQMEGAEFWKAFLFELPFALFRVVPVILFSGIAFIYGRWAVKVKRAYDREVK